MGGVSIPSKVAIPSEMVCSGSLGTYLRCVLTDEHSEESDQNSERLKTVSGGMEIPGSEGAQTVILRSLWPPWENRCRIITGWLELFAGEMSACHWNYSVVAKCPPLKRWNRKDSRANVACE